jgi:hypothetical protein
MKSMMLNLQFYVAIGTISMALTTAWSVMRQGRLDKITDLRGRISSFYIPFIHVFTHKWTTDKEFQEEWN